MHRPRQREAEGGGRREGGGGVLSAARGEEVGERPLHAGRAGEAEDADLAAAQNLAEDLHGNTLLQLVTLVEEDWTDWWRRKGRAAASGFGALRGEFSLSLRFVREADAETPERDRTDLGQEWNASKAGGGSDRAFMMG